MGEDIRAPQFHNMWDLRQPGFAFPDPVPITRAPGKVTAGRVRRRARAAQAADLGPWRAGTGSGMEAGNAHRRRWTRRWFGGEAGAGGARGNCAGRPRPELPADPSHGSFNPHEAQSTAPAP